MEYVVDKKALELCYGYVVGGHENEVLDGYADSMPRGFDLLKECMDSIQWIGFIDAGFEIFLDEPIQFTSRQEKVIVNFFINELKKEHLL